MGGDEVASLALAVIVGLGLLGGVGMGIRAILERRGLKAKAGSDEASAASILSAAARELIDPLRKELAQERAEHSEEIEMERRKVASVRRELDAALEDASTLRAMLREALAEVELHKQRISVLEQEVARLRRSGLTP